MSPSLAALALVLALASCKDDPPAPAAVALKFEPPPSNAPQGGIAEFTLTNVDRDHPFDGPAPVFVAGAVPLRFTEVSPTRLAGIALVDPMAPIGPLRLTVAARTPGGATINLSSSANDPAAPIVSLARSPLRLVPGTPAPTESISGPRLSNLYKVPVSGDDEVIFLTFATVGAALRTTSGARLVGAIAPPNGKFGDGVLFETTFDSVSGSRLAASILRGKGAGDAFIAIHTSDLSGGQSEYEYSVKASVAKGKPFLMKEPQTPDSTEKPLASIDVDGPMVALDGAIDRPEDADYVLFTPTKDGRIVVTATPVGAIGPINVSLFGNDPGITSCQAYLAGGIGRTQAEARVTAGTTYCARINSSSRQTMGYHLVVTPEL